MPDSIIIRGLDLPVLLGVPAEERNSWQVVSADITLELRTGFDSMPDDISSTVDYEAVAQECRHLAAAQPRKLLETLASELVTHLLQKREISAVEIELRKRILPGTDHVAVKVRRQR